MDRGRRKRKGRRWDSLALRIRERDDYECRVCGEWGNEVDHIVPVRQGGAMWDEDNLQVLCSPCHIQKTRKEHGGFAEGTEEWYGEWRRMLREAE